MKSFKPEYNVIVVGGGSAGVMATLTSARTEAKMLVVERLGFLGGTATNSLIGSISPFHYGDKQVIDGIPQEFMDELMATGGSTGHLKTLDPYDSGASLSFYDREKYKYVAQEMLVKAGVDISSTCSSAISSKKAIKSSASPFPHFGAQGFKNWGNKRDGRRRAEIWPR